MITLRIPALADIEAAWHGLPTDVRDRIGIAVVDMIFQEFVSGDAYVACEHFEDLPVYDEAIRNAAYQAAHKRLNEIPRLVEAALPDLFGEDENPAWCENPGSEPSPVARAWAAAERAEKAAREARPRRERSLRARLGRRGLRMKERRDGFEIHETGTGIPKIDSLDLDGVEGWLARLASRDAATTAGCAR